MLHSHRWEKQAGRSRKRQSCLIACPLGHTAVNVNFAFQITSSLHLMQATLKQLWGTNPSQAIHPICLQYCTEKISSFWGFHWKPLEVTIFNSLTFLWRNHTESYYCMFTVPSLDTVQSSANWATDFQCFNDLFSWPKYNFFAIASMGVGLLKVSEQKTFTCN